ncbi:MAG TPA: 3'-5' exonuclease [Chloroflexota bacterium]|nr:3'-5' exonuclease [Chloroflexota bacterium]
MLRPVSGGLASSPAPDWSHLLYGCDASEGIVSVDADTTGRARVWRRVGAQIEANEYRFPNWFLATSLDLLGHLPIRYVDAGVLRAAHGQLETLTPADDGLVVVELDAGYVDEDEDSYRYLVLTNRLDEVGTTLVEMCNKRDGGDAQTLADLRGLILVWPPVEQFLTLSGRTYFKNLAFDDLRRMQFDLETTGLDENRDRIFMISMLDSSGWRESLDTGSWNEARLIERFVDAVQARDPDILENHNIFAFDLPFLVKRAARLGVRLRLGRDGTEPRLETDVFDAGERAEPFLRWRITGREVVDTQQAVRRFGLGAPDMRRHGLKDAARYFGFASTDREYVAGADVWPTYRTDPDRIRRYAADDVAEVDGLSRRLMPALVGLASMLPRPYERIAADCGPTSLWELVLVRAYLHAGRAIAAPMARAQRSAGPPRPELFLTGVVGTSARAALQPLLASVLVDGQIHAANDDLSVGPGLVGCLLERPDDEAAATLASAAHLYLAGDGLLSDPEAGAQAARLARRYVDAVKVELETRGCVMIEFDTDQIVFGVPPTWTAATEAAVAAGVANALPPGVRLTFTEHYEALYARAPRSSIVLGQDGAVTLIGSSFRAARIERFGEAFMQRAAPFALRGDAVGLRHVFLEAVHRLRTAQIGLSELCMQVTLHRSLQQYRRAGTHEEPYEVLLAAGVRSWRVGQRIRYFRARGGEPRLNVEGDGLTAAEADTEYYVQRLYSAYCQQFAQAFRREDFVRVFRIPSGVGPYDESEVDADLAAVRTIAEPLRAV